jgi:hypothetical protein
MRELLVRLLDAWRNTHDDELIVGLALFPILPIGWDLFFIWRRSKRPPRKAILTRLDRLVVRTLVVSGVFLGGMMSSDCIPRDRCAR